MTAAAPVPVKIGYRFYVLAVLFAAYTANFLDRTLIMLLLEPIKQDLQLSDAQLGFMTGVGFGLFYALLSLPAARLADSRSRPALGALAIGLWGATMVACVAVANYWQMVAIRIAAAVGEAGAKPPTYSLVGDYFPAPAERARALSIYYLGGPVSALLSFMLGGWLNEQFGWRMTFAILGVPGFVIAILLLLTVRERRLGADGQERAAEALPEKLPTFRDVSKLIIADHKVRHLSLAIMIFFTMQFGIAPWYGAVLIRSHAMSTPEIGLYLGPIFGIGGIVGIALSGFVAGHPRAESEALQLRILSGAMLLLGPSLAVFLLAPNAMGSLLALCVASLVGGFFSAPAFTLLQRFVPATMRATSMSAVMFVANVSGMCIVVQAIGLLSDALAPALGTRSLSYAMLLAAALSLASSWQFWRAAGAADPERQQIVTKDDGV